MVRIVTSAIGEIAGEKGEIVMVREWRCKDVKILPLPSIEEARMAAVACTLAFSSQSGVSWHTVGITRGNKRPIVPNACR